MVEKNIKRRLNLKCICSESVYNMYSFLFPILYHSQFPGPLILLSVHLHGWLESSIKQMDLDSISLLSFLMCNVF